MLSICRTLAAALALAIALPATAATSWVERSNQLAQPLLKVMGDFNPEFAGQFGLTGYDDRIVDLGPKVDERSRAAMLAVKASLEKALAEEKDAAVRQDLAIMIDAVQQRLESQALNDRLVLAYFDVGQMVFMGEFGLLQDQIEAKRRPAALKRLERYTGLAKGSTPLTELAKARWNEKTGNAALLGPFKGEVEQSLANLPRYIAGIRQLYAKYKIKGADKALDALEAQLKDYEAWVRANVLPRARTDFRLPAELYAQNLKEVGLDIDPDTLIRKAELAYAEIRNELQALAPLVAKAHGLDATDYRDVIRALKKEQIARDHVEPTYHEVIGKLEDIIRRERIVALPQRPMLMRLASDAETAAQPAPHMDPPTLIGNKGERGTFVLPLGNPAAKGDGSETYDDFNHAGMTWTLTAHEGRPGHELQFSAMVERGVSVARSLFAFNSVNVEGWALYAEAEAKPYEPLDGQLFALQQRLTRAARAILDPELNLGRITPERATEVLTQEVVLSPAMARQEVDRYTFRAPGQATSYFYGYTRLMELRTEVELLLGRKFDRQAFNDFVVNQGLLPPDLLRKAVLEEFVPAQQKK